MNLFRHEWLGYAHTSHAALSIIKDAGFFYILISVAYLVSFLYMHWNISSVSQSGRKKHLYMVSGWMMAGGSLVLQPALTGLPFNLAIIILCILQFYYFQFFNALILGNSSGMPLPTQAEDKKIMFAVSLLGKARLTLKDIFEYSLLNERILWFVIFYKAAIAFRASLTL